MGSLREGAVRGSGLRESAQAACGGGLRESMGRIALNFLIIPHFSVQHNLKPSLLLAFLLFLPYNVSVVPVSSSKGRNRMKRRGFRLLCLLLGVPALLLLLVVLFSFRETHFEEFPSKGVAIRIVPVEPLSAEHFLNTGSAEELDALPGVGPALAQNIIAERMAHGPFTLPEDLLSVSGVGEKRLADILDALWREPVPTKWMAGP